MMAITCLTSCLNNNLMNTGSIKYGNSKFDFVEQQHILIQNSFIFDTGAEGSMVTDWSNVNYNSKVMIGWQKIIDGNNKYEFEKNYFVKCISLDSLEFHKFIITQVDTNKIKPLIRSFINKGIIGMNIISKANWLFDFKEKSFIIFPHDSILDFKTDRIVSLGYNKEFRPLVSVNINGIKVDNVLIDTGASSEIELDPETISKLYKYDLPIDTLNANFINLYSGNDHLNHYKYCFERLKINNCTVDSIHIAETKYQSLIGMGFLSRFDKMFIDTKNKTFYLY